jgi:hypothetical protein
MSWTESEGYKEFRIWAIRVLAAAVILLAAGFTLWTWAALKFVYASGERSGFVQKISKKGWVCKTWEGELAMANLPGAMPEIFEFTVRDDRVAADIEKTIGQRVSLHYEQHRGIPSTCFAETEYFVTALVPQGASVAP